MLLRLASVTRCSLDETEEARTVGEGDHRTVILPKPWPGRTPAEIDKGALGRVSRLDDRPVRRDQGQIATAEPNRLETCTAGRTDRLRSTAPPDVPASRPHSGTAVWPVQDR